METIPWPILERGLLETRTCQLIFNDSSVCTAVSIQYRLDARQSALFAGTMQCILQLYAAMHVDSHCASMLTAGWQLPDIEMLSAASRLQKRAKAAVCKGHDWVDVSLEAEKWGGLSKPLILTTSLEPLLFRSFQSLLLITIPPYIQASLPKSSHHLRGHKLIINMFFFIQSSMMLLNACSFLWRISSSYCAALLCASCCAGSLCIKMTRSPAASSLLSVSRHPCALYL